MNPNLGDVSSNVDDNLYSLILPSLYGSVLHVKTMSQL